MKNSIVNKLLVTSGLEKTWGENDEKLIFLGDWCNSYKNKDLVLSRQSITINYHWSNRDKLRHDYEYLSELFERVLLELASSLNSLHSKDYSLRYWRIVLGPWLQSYVSVLWDRWESIRVSFDQKDFNSTIAFILDSEKLVPKNFENWDQLIIDDLWNHHIFSEIINFLYKEKVNITYINYDEPYELNKINKVTRTSKHKLIEKIDKLLGKIQKKYKVVFVSSYFSIPNLVKLSIKLKQLPRVHSIFNESVNLPNNVSLKRNFRFNLKPLNIFEEFLKKNILMQIPISYLEGYETYSNQIAKIDCDGEIIFTANAHFANDLFKLWCAKEVEQGKNLIISQHGGGVKTEMTVFNHQEKIADKMIVWHKPLEAIHVQLPPNKLTSIKKKNNFRSDLTIVAFEGKLYTNRAQSGPKGKGVNDDFLQKIEFCKNLSSEVEKFIRVRANYHGPGFFNSRMRYKDELGCEKISSYSNLNVAYSYSKVIVCTYPQTTFAEALNSGIPTILLYCDMYWEFDEEFKGLILQLTKNKIIFTCPRKAATHINNIWANPNIWWNKKETIEARNSFSEMCCKKSTNWLSEWVTFFDNIKFN